MDQELRNKLRNVVTQCRRLLEEAISQELEGKYTIFARGAKVTADPDAKLANLNEEEQEARRDILDHYAHIQARGFKAKDALEQLIREIAFTHLNRLCAYKMMEAREVYVGGQKFREAVSRGVNSNGVKFYLADHPEDLRLFETGQQDLAYRHFLDWLGGQLSEEIGVLFSPTDPANRLYPRQKTLDEVLDLLNTGGIKPEEVELREQWPLIWSQDETIGWVYQYFTPKELRDKARSGNQPPANSYELAFRNQFFTPRYVVEFLTDNTLGRIWYEMRKGETRLAAEGDAAQCRYLVRRPTEIFLKEGEQPPEEAAEGQDDLSQEELLKQPVHIPHRPKKDPRELKILDPACGSGHFLLYCFDLLLTIYEEAYADPDLGPALKKDYPTLEDLRRDVPRLILAHNVHGIDIDQRASQIAALALWLRCQRAYQEMGLKKDRPKITRSNFVCAEPMPGEESMLKEFVAQLQPRLLGQVVEVVFDKMKLAGEAGSLLKIEEEIRDAVAAAKRQWEAGPVETQLSLFEQPSAKPAHRRFNLTGITDSEFFEVAEVRVIEALRSYAESAQNGKRLQRRLFTEDTVRGFAFLHLCQGRYDALLMNPPFGDPTPGTREYLRKAYPYLWSDIYSSFIVRASDLLRPDGRCGAITSRTFLALPTFEPLRDRLLEKGDLETVVECGLGVLDEATVRAAFFIFRNGHSPTRKLAFLDLKASLDRPFDLKQAIDDSARSSFKTINARTISSLPGKPFAYWLPLNFLRMLRDGPFLDIDRVNGGGEGEKRLAAVVAGLQTGDDFRFARCWWEVKHEEIAPNRWSRFAHSVGFCRFYSPSYAVLMWNGTGEEMMAQVDSLGNRRARLRCPDRFFEPGLVSPYISERGLGCSLLDADHIVSNSCRGYFDLQICPKAMLAYLNSSVADLLIYALTPDRKHEPGIIARLPVPLDGIAAVSKDLSQLAYECWRDVCILRSIDETDPRHWWSPVGTLQVLADAALRLSRQQREIDAKSASAVGMTSTEIEQLLERSGAPHDVGIWSGLQLSSAENIESSSNDPIVAFLAACVSHGVGVAFGRWNLQEMRVPYFEEQHNTANSPAYEAQSPILQSIAPTIGEEGQYPVRISTSGIIPDDPSVDEDIVSQVCNTLRYVWKDSQGDAEEAICEGLGLRELREYLRRPGKGGFWDDHVARYSKSRRKAPVYWLLQSSKKNYALWLYYHRLDKDLLFKSLVSYVDPKIRLEEEKLNAFHSQMEAVGDSGKEAKRLAKEAEKQEDFLSELRDFEDKLRRAAELHLDPDLNDGVVLNIAPLWELVPWKEPKKYWDELLAGKYEWSTIGKQLREKGLVKE